MSNTVETGLQLLARLSGRPNISSLSPFLFYKGFEKNDTCLIIGEPSSGKSLLLYNLIIDCILPSKFQDLNIGGLEAGVILIDTDHNNGILQTIHLIEQKLLSITKSGHQESLNSDEKQAIIECSLKRLTILNTYSSDQLSLNLFTIGKLLSSNGSYSLVAVDSLSSFYWEDVIKLNGIRKMDLYIQIFMQKLQSAVKEHGVNVILTRPAYFQSKSHDPAVGNFKYLIELRKCDTGNNGEAIIKTKEFLKTYQYSVGSIGFSWTIDSCGSGSKFQELRNKIESLNQNVVVNGTLGRQGSFEIVINDQLVYSKLATLAYPDFNAVTDTVMEVTAGQNPRKIEKQQPITDCCLM